MAGKRKEDLEWVKDPANLLVEMYSRLIQRSERNNLPKIEFKKNRFLCWAYDRGFYNLYESWELSNYLWNLRPTVDRIDSTQGYNIHNMQLLTWKDNKHKEIWDVIKTPRKDNSSGYTGVWYNNQRKEGIHKRWQAHIRVDGKLKTRCFLEKQDAINQRIVWEEEYFGIIR